MNANHARFNSLANDRSGKNLPACVPQPNSIAILYAARLSIVRMNGYRLTVCYRVQFAQRTVIQLAVQTMCRMSRKYLQLFRFGIALPLVRLQPHWMPRAIRISVISNTLREDFNLAAGGF